MKKVCIPLAEGFEEMEAVILIDVLRRAGFSVTTCWLTASDVTGAHGVTVPAELGLDEALARSWDLVVLPGGMPGATHLRDEPRIGRLLEKTHAAGHYVGAICAAPIVLGRYGLLSGRRATSYPGFADQLDCAEYCEDSVVVDGRVLTSRGPGTAFAFALKIVALLADAEKAASLKAAMLL